MVRLRPPKSGQHERQYAKGGDDRMFSKQAAGPQKPGVTAHAVKGGAPGAKAARGGSTRMADFTPVQPARPGRTGADSVRKKGR